MGDHRRYRFPPAVFRVARVIAHVYRIKPQLPGTV